MTTNVVPSAISDGPSLIVTLYDAARTVKVHKTRLGSLTCQCGDLLSTIMEHSPELVDTTACAEAYKIERAIERIRNRVLVWAGYGERTAFCKQNEIRLGINECYRELLACSKRFVIALSMVDESESRGREEARQRDHKKLQDLLAGFLTVFEEGSHSGGSMVSEPPQDSQNVETFEAQGGANKVVISQPTRSGDLSGKVSVVTDHVAIEGRFLEFYLGEWASEGAPAVLGRPRDQSRTSQMRFKEKVESWHDLQHQNVLRFFGHVEIDGIVYSVSPWMANRNIRDYARENPGADRMRLLIEVASGMRFLHEKGIVHGDLCGKNVLIDEDGKAFVCGFSLSEFEDLTTDLSRHRWLATERLTAAGVTSPTFEADVWSFGLVCLEVFTGADPYRTFKDYYVPVLLSKGKSPEHPGTAAVGLSSKMWELMQSCWEVDPAARPDMLKIQLAMRDITPQIEPHPTAMSHRLSTSSVRIEPLRPTLISLDGGSAHDTNGSSSESSSSSIPPPLIPPRPSGGQLTLEPSSPRLSSTIPPPLLSPLPELETTLTLNNDSVSPSLGTLRLLPLREDDYEPEHHSAGISIPISVPAMVPPQSSRSSPRQSTASSWSPQSTLASEFLGRTSPTSTSSPTQTSQTSPSTESVLPKWTQLPKRTQLSASGTAVIQRKSSKSKSRSQTNPAETLTRSSIILANITTIHQRVPASEDVLHFLKSVASDPESLLQLAKDGTVSAGNLEGLISRAIIGSSDSFRDERFKATFLTIYQLFATSEQVFEILKRRFEATDVDPGPPMAGSPYLILLFIESWLNKGFEDPELACSSRIREFACSVTGSPTMEAKAREIEILVDDPGNVRLRDPESCPRLRSEPAPSPSSVTPSDVAMALTVIEGNRFDKITHWDYVNDLIRVNRDPKTRRLDIFNAVHYLIKIWVQRTVLEFDYLDERMKKYEFWIYTAKACRKLNNFSSTSAIVAALISPSITELILTCDSRSAKQVLHELATELADVSYRHVIQNAGTKTLIPWLDPHLGSLNTTFVESNPIMEVDGHPLVDFKLFSELADQVNELDQYTPPRIEHTTRQDVLAHVEYSLKSHMKDDTLTPSINDLSAKRALEESAMLVTRERLRSLGLPWLPPRRSQIPMHPPLI